jgi:hypothetical protein
MTKRHNRLASVVRKAIVEYLRIELRSGIQENEEIRQEELSEGLQNLRPDIVFERRTVRGLSAPHIDDQEERTETNKGQMIEILEFSCSHGHISHGSDSLQRVYTEKKRKYTDLATELRRLRRGQI